MRKQTLLAFCLLSMLFPTGAQAASQPDFTACNWLFSGKQCTTQQMLDMLFPAPKHLVGCKAKLHYPTYSSKTSRAVALSFDDGPSPYTKPILRVLKRNGVHAAFFVVGQQVRMYPNALRQTLEEGNIVGNHSWNHPMLTSRSVNAQQQISWTQSVVRKTSGYTPCLMRPPYGLWNQRVLQSSHRQKLQPVLWDIDTADWSTPGVGRIVNAASAARPGSIILMHDGGGYRGQTLAALPQIIHNLKQKGLRIVRLDRLIGAKSRMVR